MIKIHYTTFAGISGHIMVISLLMIMLFSVSKLRQFKYELFYYTHQFFYFIILAYHFHGIGCFVKTSLGICKPYYSFFINIPVFILFLSERIYRATRRKTFIKRIEFSRDVIKLTIDKRIKCSPAQYISINCPDISKFQWHSFTISSSGSGVSNDTDITIRILGDWTLKFSKYLRTTPISNQEIYVDGPFCSPCDSVWEFNKVILVASGIGITPFISIICSLIERKSLFFEKINIIWINNHNESFDWFNNEIVELQKLPFSKEKLSVNVYLTEKYSLETINLITKENTRHLNYIKNTDTMFKYGRPDFKKIFNEFSQDKVGVFVCGNESLFETIETHTKKRKNFVCVRESF
jgi:NADPH oxidase